MIMELYEEEVINLIHEKIPQSKHHLIVIDDDNPEIGYVGDGFLDDNPLEKLNLPEKIENDSIEIYGFESYEDENFVPDEDLDKNTCLKFKIKVKDN